MSNLPVIDFRPEPLKIMLDTNIIGSKDLIPFTRSMLKIPDSNIKSFIQLEEYPYFTNKVLYPQYIIREPYIRRLEFFFNRTNFNKILSLKNPQYVAGQLGQRGGNGHIVGGDIVGGDIVGGDIVGGDIVGGADTNSEEYHNKMDENYNTEENIVFMLKCLFPTKYPVYNNILTSHKLKILEQPQMNLDVSTRIMKLFSSYTDTTGSSGSNYPDFSYMNINGKVQTVCEVIWVNDLYNHYVYGKILKSYVDLRHWMRVQSGALQTDIQQQIGNLKELYGPNNEKFQKDISGDLTAIRTIVNSLVEAQNKGKIVSSDTTNQKNLTRVGDLIITIPQFQSELKAGVQLGSIEDLNNRLQTAVEQIKHLVDNRELQINSSVRNVFTEINRLATNIENIKNIQYLIQNYFEQSNIKFEFSSDPNIPDALKEQYKRYKEFIDSVQAFGAKTRRTTNRFLQDVIQQYLNRVNPNFIELVQPGLMRTSTTFSNPGFKQLLNVGVSIVPSETPNHEIHVRMDFIGGEINNENVKNIKCIYKGEKLTEQLDTILQPAMVNSFWQLNPRRMYYDSEAMVSHSIGGPTSYKNGIFAAMNESTNAFAANQTNPSGTASGTAVPAPGAVPGAVPGAAPDAAAGPDAPKTGGNRKTRNKMRRRASTRKLKRYFMLREPTDSGFTK